jgi:hypothetical protein
VKRSSGFVFKYFNSTSLNDFHLLKPHTMARARLFYGGMTQGRLVRNYFGFRCIEQKLKILKKYNIF